MSVMNNNSIFGISSSHIIICNIYVHYFVAKSKSNKYTYTLCFEVMDLKTNEMNCVADHLGHSLERTYFQVAPSVIQRATISKLLTLADRGKVKISREELEFKSRTNDSVCPQNDTIGKVQYNNMIMAEMAVFNMAG